jgi:chromatin remodeling complex protein RSC6
MKYMFENNLWKLIKNFLFDYKLLKYIDWKKRQNKFIKYVMPRIIKKYKKTMAKAKKKHRLITGNRTPSGFCKPTKISSELASFLGTPKKTKMSRSEVTHEICKYIRAHNLKKDNSRIILANSKLQKLLKLKKNDELTYFSLQRYIKHCFAKNV